jgi:hypothetical protein
MLFPNKIFLHAHLQVVYYKCVKFHKNPISGLGGIVLTRYMDGRTGRFLYIPPPPNFVCGGYNYKTTDCNLYIKLGGIPLLSKI